MLFFLQKCLLGLIVPQKGLKPAATQREKARPTKGRICPQRNQQIGTLLHWTLAHCQIIKNKFGL
jgi:hypothetical protein